MKKSILILSLALSLLVIPKTYAVAPKPTNIDSVLMYSPRNNITYDVTDKLNNSEILFSQSLGTYGNYSTKQYYQNFYEYFLLLLKSINNGNSNSLKYQIIKYDYAYPRVFIYIINSDHPNYNPNNFEIRITPNGVYSIYKKDNSAFSNLVTSDPKTWTAQNIFNSEIISAEITLTNDNSGRLVFATPFTQNNNYYYGSQIPNSSSLNYSFYKNNIPLSYDLLTDPNAPKFDKTNYRPDYYYKLDDKLLEITFNKDAPFIVNSSDYLQLKTNFKITNSNNDVIHNQDYDALDVINYPFSVYGDYKIELSLLPKAPYQFPNEYNLLPKEITIKVDGGSMIGNTSNLDCPNGVCSPKKLSLAEQLANFAKLFNFTFENPFSSFFNAFKSGDSCASVPILAGMLKAPSSTYCSWFSQSTRNTLTPVFSLASMMLVFGFFIRWLSGSSGDGSVLTSDNDKGFYGRRFK